MQLGDNDIVIYVGGNITDFQQKMSQAKAITATTSASISSTLGRTLVSGSDAMRRWGNTFVGAAGAASVGVVYPLTRISSSIFDTGKEFDLLSQKTVSVFDLMGKSVEEVRYELQQFTYELAGTTMFTASEIMESMYGMAQAGMQVEDVYAIMPEVIKLATAQSTDLDTAFKMIFATLSAYNMEATEATRVTHAIAAAASASVLDVEDLTVALKYINPTFASLGYSLEEGLAMTAMLRDLSFTGQNAGRILRDAFTDLIAPTSRAAEIIRKYNLSIYTNGEELNGLVAEYHSASEALDALNSSEATSQEEIQKHKDFIIELEGQLNRLDKTSEKYIELKKALDEALYAEKVMKNEVKKSNAEIEKQTAKVKALEKQVNSFSVTGVKDPGEIFSEFSRAMSEGMTSGEFSQIFGKQSYAAMIQLSKGTEQYSELLDKITYDTEKGSEATRQADIILQSTAAQHEVLMGNLSTMASEIYGSVEPALFKLFTTINNNVGGIKDFAIMIAQNFIPIVQTAVDHVMGLINWFNGLDTGTKELIAKVTAMGIAFTLVAVPLMLFSGIVMWSLSPFVKLIGNLLLSTSGVGKLGLALQALNPNAQMVSMEMLGFRQVLEKVAFSATNITGPITVAKGALTSFITSLKTLGVGGAVQSLVVGGFSSLTGVITGLGGAFSAAIATIGSTIVALLPLIGWILLIVAAVAALWLAWKNNWGGIRDITASVVGFITEHLKGLFDFLKNTVGVVIDSIRKLISAFVEGDINGIFNALGNLIGGIVRLIGGLPLKFLETGFRMIVDFAKGIIKAAPHVYSSLKTWILEGGIQQFIRDAIDAAINAGKAFIKGFIDGITGKSPEVEKTVKSVGDSVKDESKSVGGTITDSIGTGIEDGLPDIYQTMADGAEESVNVFKRKFDESFGKLDMKSMTDENQMQFKAFELTKDIVDLSDLSDEEKQFVGEVQTIIDENGGEIPDKLKKTLDAQIKESKPFSAFHEEFRKEFDLILYEWDSFDSTIITKLKKGYRLSSPFINFEDGLQTSEKQLIGFLDSVASETGKLPEDLQRALDTKLKMNQPLDEWWADFYQEWKDTEKLVIEPVVKTVTLNVEIIDESTKEIENELDKVETNVTENAKESSILYNNNFSEVLSGKSGTPGLVTIINGEFDKTTEVASKSGETTANEFVDKFNTTVEGKELKITFYPSLTFDNTTAIEPTIDGLETDVTQTVTTTVVPTVDSESAKQANTTSKEEGKELVDSYKSGIEEKKPELESACDTISSTVLEKLDLGTKAYDLGRAFVQSYTNGITTTFPALRLAVDQMSSILDGVESSTLYNNKFSDILTGKTGATGLNATINDEFGKTVTGAGKSGEDAANEYIGEFNTKIKDERLEVSIYPSVLSENIESITSNFGNLETDVTQAVTTTVIPITSEERRDQANAVSREEGKELIDSYKAGIEENEPELESTKSVILEELNLGTKAYELGYGFVKSYADGVVAAFPILRSVVKQINGILDNIGKSTLFKDNFSDVISEKTGVPGIGSIVNSELEKTVNNAGKFGKGTANEFTDEFNTTIKDNELEVSIYPSLSFDNIKSVNSNLNRLETNVAQTVTTNVVPITDEEKKNRANIISRGEGIELIESYKAGVEEKEPELETTFEAIKNMILEKLNLGAKAFELGYAFVKSYTNGILAALPALRSAVNQMKSVVDSMETLPAIGSYNIAANTTGYGGLPEYGTGGTTNNYNIDVNLNNATIRNESDVEKLANAVYERISRNMGLMA